MPENKGRTKDTETQRHSGKPQVNPAVKHESPSRHPAVNPAVTNRHQPQNPRSTSRHPQNPAVKPSRHPTPPFRGGGTEGPLPEQPDRTSHTGPAVA